MTRLYGPNHGLRATNQAKVNQMELTTTTAQQLLSEAQQFATMLKDLRDYDQVKLWYVELRPTGEIYAHVYGEDDFQNKIAYQHRHKHGSHEVPYPFHKAIDEWPTREERELRVLLAQQGESTALVSEIRSASAKRFVNNLCAERTRYAQLVDFTKGRED